MASLPTPIATLQLQLHVFYDALILTFVIAINSFRGASVLSILTCGEARLLNVAQMRPDVFNKLLNWLQEHTKIDHALCKVKILSLIWSLTERST